MSKSQSSTDKGIWTFFHRSVQSLKRLSIIYDSWKYRFFPLLTFPSFTQSISLRSVKEEKLFIEIICLMPRCLATWLYIFSPLAKLYLHNFVPKCVGISQCEPLRKDDVSSRKDIVIKSLSFSCAHVTNELKNRAREILSLSFSMLTEYVTQIFFLY
jgi:hypothetical protein